VEFTTHTKTPVANVATRSIAKNFTGLSSAIFLFIMINSPG
jgi:hypothetical protein